jgi:MYXO-CTERM domain-containing protein
VRRVLIAALLGLLAVAALSAPGVVAGNDNRAVVVVGKEAECVAFRDTEIDGIELLERSSFAVETERNAQGAAVCRLDGMGCSTEDCFCEFPDFWGYWTKDGDEWEFSQTGATERMVRDGSIDGWTYGKDGKPAPGDVDFDEVCAVAAPTLVDVDDTAPTRPPYEIVVMFAVVLALAVALLVRRRRRPP